MEAPLRALNFGSTQLCAKFPFALPGGPFRAEDRELCAVDDDVGVGGGVAAQLEVAGVAVGAEIQRRLAHLAPDAHRVRGKDHLRTQEQRPVRG